MTDKELDLIDAWLDDDLSDDEVARLEAWMRAEPGHLEAFARAGLLHQRLRDLLRAQAITGNVAGIENGREAAGAEPEVPGPADSVPFPFIVVDSSGPLTASRFALDSSLRGWIFSYAAATVITCMAILGAWVYKVSHDYQLVKYLSPPASSPEKTVEPEPACVGRITGMADCRWADRQDAPSAAVSLGRKYELASGLVEIAYESGAKVILQGPCTYEVESPRGGFLSLGKLTARVEKKNEVVSGQWSVVSEAKSEDRYPLTTNHHPLFFVRTPTAVVTDLGTEFGVEVDQSGATRSHVFRGKVELRPTNADKAADRHVPVICLGADESACVESGEGTGVPRLVPPGAVGKTPRFVRWLVEPPKVLDLLDVVAGGDGTGCRRECGIDPTTGLQDPAFIAHRWCFDRQDRPVPIDCRYRPVPWCKDKLVDGVLIPNCTGDPVVLDSAGHTFNGFPADEPGYQFGAGTIWARAAAVKQDERTKDPEYWIFAMGSDKTYMPEGRGLLGMQSNGGITFNLDAMRKLHQGARPARFRAVAGMGDAHRVFPQLTNGLADVWVFVDGRLKFQRTRFRAEDGVVKVDVELSPNDRFLTLVSTDGGDHTDCDWVVFGDPVLEMAPQQ